MIPLVAGAFGLFIGFMATPNPVGAIICGTFLAIVGWAITGFRIGSDTKTKDAEIERVHSAESLPLPLVEPLPSQAPSFVQTPDEAQAESRWRIFKLKAFFVIAAVLIAANYERCTENPEDRIRKDVTASQRMQGIARENAYEDCKQDGTERECRDAAQRAGELARDKAQIINGR
jgi:hypothetical protein